MPRSVALQVPYTLPILFFLLSFFTISLLVTIVLTLGLFLSQKRWIGQEKISPFECGFTPKFRARLPFSIRFFLVALLFVVFDVELVLIFPLVTGISILRSLQRRVITFRIILILLAGLAHEWNQGRLD